VPPTTGAVAERPGRAAVLGTPVAHSLSPVLHRAAYAALGLKWRYDAIECNDVLLPTVLAERGDWVGFSCTMPLKRAVLAVADEVRPLAAAVGAGNTLLPRPGGGWIADNTDVAGIVCTLRSGGVEPSSVTVLGAGGTAQAAIGALAALGIARCSVLVRDGRRAGELRSAADRLGVVVTLASLDVTAAELAADLVVSTLPGRAGDSIAATRWRPDQTLLDVVYDPWPTVLAAAAQASGARVLSGASMLLHQAAAQVELMTGHPAPLEAMRAALRAARPRAGV
jgi:shikimate dehydrogenase